MDYSNSKSSQAEILEAKASSALQNNPYLPRRKWRIEASDGRLALHGRVNSWYQKQMAQETLLQLDGVEKLENHLEVCWS
jgi:osmotically-inducible protein OsmY